MEIIVFSILIGIVLIFLEFILPSFGALSVMALLCYVYAIYEAFSSFGVYEGFLVTAICLCVSIFAISFAIILFPKLKFTKALSLNSNATPIEDNSVEFVGKVGVALTDMSLSGKVEIEGREYDAQSNLYFIEKDSKVEVVAKDNFKLIVKNISSK